MADDLQVHVELPDDWFALSFDPKPRRRRRALAEQVDTRIVREPALAADRDLLVDWLLGVSAEAAAKGALIGAVGLDVAGGVEVARHLVLYESAALPGTGGGPPAETAAQLADVLRRRDEGDVGGRDVEVVELPAGPALRLRWLSETDTDAAGHAAILDGVQYWVPTADDSVLVLSGSTPTMNAADGLIETVDRVARTLVVGGRG